MACLPCMLSYGWIFQKLLEEKPSVQDTLYGALVVDYADKGYEAACRDWAAFAEKSAKPERRAPCPLPRDLPCLLGARAELLGHGSFPAQ